MSGYNHAAVLNALEAFLSTAREGTEGCAEGGTETRAETRGRCGGGCRDAEGRAEGAEAQGHRRSRAYARSGRARVGVREQGRGTCE